MVWLRSVCLIPSGAGGFCSGAVAGCLSVASQGGAWGPDAPSLSPAGHLVRTPGEVLSALNCFFCL